MSNSVCGVIMDQGFIDFYKKLISINSISSEIPEQDISNEKVIDFLDTYLSGKGFTTRKLPVKNARNKFNLIATTEPKDLTVNYTSSNPSVVTVDDKGNVVAKGAGTAIITVNVGGDGVYAENSTTICCSCCCC